MRKGRETKELRRGRNQKSRTKKRQKGRKCLHEEGGKGKKAEE